MKKGLAVIAAAVLSTAPLISIANTTPMSSPEPGFCPNLYLLVGLGYSDSRKTDLYAPPNIWDPAVQGYNSDVKTSVIYSVGMGYNFAPAFSADVQLNVRPGFSYSRFQSPLPNPGTPGFLGSKTRKFRLDNYSLMVNVNFNPMVYGVYYDMYEGMTIAPIMGLGAGVAYNTVWDFHSVQVTSATPGLLNVASIENPYRKASFAWQFMIGAELMAYRTWALDIAYRYFNGGQFKSNNYIASVPVDARQPRQTLPWKGKLKANELVVNLKYNFT